MAYSLYEESQLDSPKSVQYYPEEYDYSYYHKIPEVKVNYQKKSKRATSSVNYVNERKCPIYVHQFNKDQNVSTYNNYSSKATAKPSVEKNPSSKLKKIPGFPTTKSVLDQLEETYWATWKPNKESVSSTTKKNKAPNNRNSKIEAYGDVPENIVNYYNISEYENSTVEESDYDQYEYNKSYETVIDIEPNKNTAKLTTTHTQEIQTDSIVITLPKVEAENMESVEKLTNDHSETIEQTTEMEENEKPKDKIGDEESETTQEISSGEKSKFLKHTDSFIINKKKQSEVKEHFQQPKCIRLYRKPGISTNFIRGGTYPLKSCLKREPTPKGNFRLGAPGSPLFVSMSSFHKKSRK